MVTRKSRAEIERMRQAGRVVAEVLDRIEAELKPGVSTAHLDAIAEAHIRASGAIPSFKGYPGINPRRPFPASVCISIDDEIVHGIPGQRTIRAGQVVSVDAGAIVDGTASIEDVGWELFRLMLEVASGRRKTWAEQWQLHNALVLFNPAPVT